MACPALRVTRPLYPVWIAAAAPCWIDVVVVESSKGCPSA